MIVVETSAMFQMKSFMVIKIQGIEVVKSLLNLGGNVCLGILASQLGLEIKAKIFRLMVSITIAETLT